MDRLTRSMAIQASAFMFLAVAGGAKAGLPGSARADAEALVGRLARAGADPQALDRQRVEALFDLQTKPDCYHFESPQGHVFSCRYLPAAPQTGPVRFVEYLTSRLNPGTMKGGNVEWSIDRSALCLTQADLERLLGKKPVPARLPLMPELLAGSRPVEVRSYDFTLLDRQPEPNYLAVYERDGCVDRLRLSTYFPPQ